MASPVAAFFRRNRLWLTVGAALVLAAAVAVPTLRYHLSHVVTDDAYVTGRLIPLSASVPGRIDTIFAAEGDTLVPGRMLARLADAAYRADLARAEAAVARALSLLAEAEILLEREKRRAGPIADQFEADLVATQARVEGARAAEEQAGRTLERVERMARSGLVSDSELDAARIAHKRRKAELDDAGEQVHKAAAAVKITDGHLDDVRAQHQRVETARASLALARSEAQRAQVELDGSRVLCPARGVVARLTCQVGQRVEEGQTLAFVRDLDTLWVVANVEETQIRKVHVGQPVEVTVDAFPDRNFRGRVARVGSVTGSQFAVIPREGIGGSFVKVVQRVPVGIAVDDPEGALKLGLSAVVGIDVRPGAR